MKAEKSKYQIDLDECIKNRKKHYPPIEDVVAAMFEGVGDEMSRIKALRNEVKAKFPKPDPANYTSDEEYQKHQDSAPMKKSVKPKQGSLKGKP